jgi:hypothetical protein
MKRKLLMMEKKGEHCWWRLKRKSLMKTEKETAVDEEWRVKSEEWKGCRWLWKKRERCWWRVEDWTLKRKEKSRWWWEKKESAVVVNEEVVVSCRSHGGWLIEKEIRPYCFRVNVICVLLLATGYWLMLMWMWRVGA